MHRLRTLFTDSWAPGLHRVTSSNACSSGGPWSVRRIRRGLHLVQFARGARSGVVGPADRQGTAARDTSPSRLLGAQRVLGTDTTRSCDAHGFACSRPRSASLRVSRGCPLRPFCAEVPGIFGPWDSLFRAPFWPRSKGGPLSRTISWCARSSSTGARARRCRRLLFSRSFLRYASVASRRERGVLWCASRRPLFVRDVSPLLALGTRAPRA